MPLALAQKKHVSSTYILAHLSHTSTLSPQNLQGSPALVRQASTAFWCKPQQTRPLDAACQPIDTIPGQTSHSYKYCLHARACTRTLETLLSLGISVLSASLPDLALLSVRLAVLFLFVRPQQISAQEPAPFSLTRDLVSWPSASLTKQRQRAAAFRRPAGGCICTCPTLAADPGISLLCPLWRSPADCPAAWRRPTQPQPQPRLPNRSPWTPCSLSSTTLYVWPLVISSFCCQHQLIHPSCRQSSCKLERLYGHRGKTLGGI